MPLTDGLVCRARMSETTAESWRKRRHILPTNGNVTTTQPISPRSLQSFTERLVKCRQSLSFDHGQQMLQGFGHAGFIEQNLLHLST